MKTFTSLSAILMAGALATQGVCAQERSVGSAGDVQSSWTALKTLTHTANTKADAATARIDLLEPKVANHALRLGQVESTLVNHSSRLVTAASDIDNLNNQIITLSNDISILSDEANRQKGLLNKVLGCSAKQKFYILSSNICANATTSEPSDPQPTKVTRTFSVGANDCGDLRCIRTASTAKKICTRNGYENVQGSPVSANYAVGCGLTVQMKQWNDGNNNWNLNTYYWARTGGSGGDCIGAAPVVAYLTSVTCYKYQ